MSASAPRSLRCLLLPSAGHQNARSSKTTHVEAISRSGTSRDHVGGSERDESGSGEGELGEHFERRGGRFANEGKNECEVLGLRAAGYLVAVAVRRRRRRRESVGLAKGQKELVEGLVLHRVDSALEVHSRGDAGGALERLFL